MKKKYFVYVILASSIVAACTIRFWWVTTPCERYFYRNRDQLTQYSELLISNHDKLKEPFPLPDWLLKSDISDLDLHKDYVDFYYYRYYTFPDGPMDHLVYSKSGVLPSGIRKPVFKVTKLSSNWYYVETD